MTEQNQGLHMERRERPKFGYGLFVEKDVMISMRDGVDLATDIYRPAVNDSLAPGKARMKANSMGNGRNIRPRSHLDRLVRTPLPRCCRSFAEI